MGINQELIKKATEKQFRNDIPEFRSGDTLAVHVKIKEGEKERVQIFRGFVLKTAGTGNSRTVTVRKDSFGVGIERTFPVNSPNIVKFDLEKLAKVRRARIFYMRDRKGKSARLKEDKKRANAAKAKETK